MSGVWCVIEGTHYMRRLHNLSFLQPIYRKLARNDFIVWDEFEPQRAIFLADHNESVFSETIKNSLAADFIVKTSVSSW